MGLVMDICDTICAISFGKLLAIGTPSEIQNNNEVLVNSYNIVMTTLNIENNDLNSINESAIMSGTNQTLKNAYLTIKEYMNNQMATIERYDLH